MWTDGPIVGFDTETTGVDPDEARLVTAAIDVYDADGVRTNTHHWLINPGVDIPDAAAEVHGVTTERARAEGDDPQVAVRQIAVVLAHHWLAGYPVVAYNAAYDFTVLDRELRRHTGAPLAITGPILDPMVLDKHVDRYVKGTGQRKLQPTCERYGITLTDWHAADADAEAAVLIARAIGRKYAATLPADLRDLWRLQVAAKREQSAGLTEYFRKSGQTEPDGSPIIVAPHWPIYPVKD